jgi:hypothetical protein
LVNTIYKITVPVTPRLSFFTSLGATFVVVFCGIMLVAGGGFEARGTSMATIDFLAMHPTVVAVCLVRAAGVGWSPTVVVVAGGSKGG